MSLPGASRRVLGLSLSAGTVRLTIYDAMANLAHSYPAVKQVGIQSKSAGLYGYGSRYDPSGCQGAGILSRHAERFSDSTTKGDGWVDVNKSGDHTIFIGEVLNAGVIREGKPLSLAETGLYYGG